MHYWVRGLCRILTRRRSFMSLLLLILCPATLAFGDRWCGNNGGDCSNNNGLGSPFVQPNRNISGLCPQGIFDGRFINGPNSGGFPAGRPNNCQVSGDFLGSNFGSQFSQFPQNGQDGGRIPHDPIIQPPQFPTSNKRDRNFGNNIPGPPPSERRGSFVGPPPPYPRQPIGPMQPQFDNRDFDNHNINPNNNQFGDGFGDGFIDRRGGPLLPSRPTITSTDNTNTGVTFSGRNEDLDRTDLTHTFDNHRRRRRSITTLSRFRQSTMR